MSADPASPPRAGHGLVLQWLRIRAAVHARTAHLPPTTRALLWAAAAGLLFSILNALMRALGLHDVFGFRGGVHVRSPRAVG